MIGKPIYMTQEERDALSELWKDHAANHNNYGHSSHYGSGDLWDDSPYDNGVHYKPRHEWVSTVLIISTVETCKLCGAKKEKSKDIYCEDKK